MSEVEPGIHIGFSKPFLEQIEFLLAKVNKPTKWWTNVWRDEHDVAFMVAGAYKADLLADLREAVNKAITETRSLDAFRKDFDKIVEQRGWSYNGGRNWRTRLIYETNMRTSYQAGRYAQMTDPDLIAAAPYWRYKHSDLVADPRHEHLAWNGLVLRHDDPWWKSHYPPNGWGCRCTVLATSRKRAEREGYTISDASPAAEVETKMVGERSGKPRTVQVPKGIDPGWDYAPGATRAAAVRTAVASKVPLLPSQLGLALSASVDSIQKPPNAPEIKAISKRVERKPPL